jgi:uncharacterized membrane protein YeaQ/YmgE (transglycosylase-associated protein family)
MTAVQSSAVAPRNLARSVGAVVAGIVVNALGAFILDEILHLLGVFPPWGQVTYATVPYLLATSYRIVLGVLGAYVTAWLAPRNPMRHVMVLAGLGLLASLGGLTVALTHDLGPVWYAAVLVVLALPLAFLGGWLYVRRHA